MNANETTESRIKCYGDREMTTKSSELKAAGYIRTNNAYWVEHWTKGAELVILERCNESERPTETKATEFSELSPCKALYRVTATASGIYSDFTDRHIAEKELQNLINNGKAATLIEIAQ